MIKIRLKKFGKKREASYRIVVMNADDRRDGRPLEELGFYNPRTNETRFNVERTIYRLQTGAQPTETVCSLLRKNDELAKFAPTKPIQQS
jgi:small subunit ribosomal protein S16